MIVVSGGLPVCLCLVTGHYHRLPALVALARSHLHRGFFLFFKFHLVVVIDFGFPLHF